MEQVQSQEYLPEMPSGVRKAARFELVCLAVFFAVMAVLMLVAPREHVLWKYSWKGVEHIHRATGPGPQLFGLAVLTGLCMLFILPLLYTLRGRMWAFWTTLVINILTLPSMISDAFRYSLNPLMVPIVYVVWAFLLGFRHYRAYARSLRTPSTR